MQNKVDNFSFILLASVFLKNWMKNKRHQTGAFPIRSQSFYFCFLNLADRKVNHLTISAIYFFIFSKWNSQWFLESPLLYTGTKHKIANISYLVLFKIYTQKSRFVLHFSSTLALGPYNSTEHFFLYSFLDDYFPDASIRNETF